MKPRDLPPPERWAHGTRARYVAARCRCAPCRAANAAYYHTRKGKPWNGLVPAAPARRHLLRLRKAGVGRRSVAAASDVAETVIADILSGRKRTIRQKTATALLEITPAARADASLVDATKTWLLLRRLLDEGFSKAALSRRIGSGRRALQIGKRKVRASTAHRVARFYRMVNLGA